MNTTIVLIAIAVIVIWNIIVFALYAADKRKAAKNKWRISEATLITCAFLMGGVGAFLGMRILRHKTQHWQFKLLVPLAVIINIAVVVFVVWFVRGF